MRFGYRAFVPHIVLAIIAACLLFLATSARAQSMPGFQPPNKGQSANQLSNSQKAARGQAPLAKLYGHLKANAAKIKRLPALEQRAQKLKFDKRLQIGVARPLPTELNPLTDSAVYSVAEGEVRVAEVVSTGAFYTRLHFKDMSLPPGARVFVYSASNPDQFAGPYEGRGPWGDGMFWTPPLPGDQIMIEYTVPAGTTSTDVPFRVSEVSHVYKDVFSADNPAGSCNIELSLHQEWMQVAKSVGLLDFLSGGTEFVCTGTLLNDAAQDQKPFVLTANHCISSQSEAQSTVVYWNYLSGDFPSGTQTTTGANLLVTGSASDFTLLLLTGSVPTANVFFSGWDANPVAASVAITGIHHPSGSHKRISFGATTGDGPVGLPGPGQNFTGVTWSQGVTEPGSSGSGIWMGTPPPNGDPTNVKLVGQLYGGFSDCSNPSGADYYGRFSVTYQNISGFLNGSCVTAISPTSQNFSGSGGAGAISVTAGPSCNWTATSTDAFVTITSGSSGNGNGTINFSVSANPNGVPRTAFIVAGAQVFTVNEDRKSDGPCTSGTIALNQTLNGNLQSGCLRKDGQYVNAYSFSTNAPSQQVIVSMSSAQFDTYLYLLNADGTVLDFNDDISISNRNSRIPTGSGVVTLPSIGTYTILASAFYAPGDTPNDPGMGSYTLTLATPRTLTIASSPNSGVTIAVNPIDTHGASGNGTTLFTRTFAPNVSATLVAPGSAGPNTIFQKWQKDGVDLPSSAIINVTMDSDHTLTAVYRPLNDYVLTIGSSNPSSGVPITISPNDNNGFGNGTTPQFTRTYKENSTVSLTAPATAPDGSIFQAWQVDGQPYATRFFNITMIRNITMIAVYAPPATFALTVGSSNPGSGVNITVSPNDKNGFADGPTPFTRSYNQNTNVTLTAPSAAPNGNVFSRWQINALTVSFSPTYGFSMAGNTTVTVEYATKPFVWLETGTSNAVAVNSVTFLHGPFQILDSHNFSTDGHTRILLLTSDLALTQANLSDPAVLVVTVQTTTQPVQGWTLPVEAVGPFSGAGLSGSYIVMKLPDGVPTGAQLELRVRLRQTTSDASYITFAP